MYCVEYTDKVLKEFSKLDRSVLMVIKAWIDKNLVNCENPRIHGKALATNLKGRWRYRIGDYRLLVAIDDNKLIILAIGIGHRKEIYK